MNDIKFMLKPKSVSYDEIVNVIKLSHIDALNIGIKFGTTNINSSELKSEIENEGFCLIAKLGKRVIGTLSVCIENINSWFYVGKIARIKYVAVLPDYQRQLVASKLLSMALDLIKKNNIGVVVVSTPYKNVRALKLYYKFKFENAEFYKVNDYFVVKMVLFFDEKLLRKIKIRFYYQKMKVKLILKNMFILIN